MTMVQRNGHPVGGQGLESTQNDIYDTLSVAVLYTTELKRKEKKRLERERSSL